MKPILLIASVAFLLAACDQLGDQLGLNDAQRKEMKADAEGKAVGSACRQSGRAIEDCYSLYRWLPKASIFSGWREMNDYMQANNINVVEPKLPPAPPPEDKKKKKTLAETAAMEEKKTADGEAKAGDKPASKDAVGADKPTDNSAEKKPDAKDDKAAAKH